MNAWSNEDRIYLEDLSKVCAELAQRYKSTHETYKGLQSRIKIPSIILSSTAGLASFGTGTFPSSAAYFISISVGVINLCLAIAGSIEAYFQYNEILQKSLKVSAAFQKLAEDVSLELSLPECERQLSGIAQVRESYNQYENILNECPAVLKKLRFVKGSITPRLSSAQNSLEAFTLGKRYAAKEESSAKVEIY